MPAALFQFSYRLLRWYPLFSLAEDRLSCLFGITQTPVLPEQMRISPFMFAHIFCTNSLLLSLSLTPVRLFNRRQSLSLSSRLV